MGALTADSFHYDLVSYPTGAFPETHPRRLATLAALYGLAAPTAPSFAGARILELGCGSGGNLIPLAYSLPGATLLGVDLAGREIAAAEQWAARLGLTNVTFRCLDIRELTAALGTFDYIVAHGVYSWVPPAVQERLLWVCGNLLSENGVAYVSYNALPGGHLRRLIDDMMKYHTRHESDPAARVERSRALTNTLVHSVAPQDTLYRSLLTKERDRLAELEPAVFFHDDLAEFNEAVFLHEFVARAARHGLRYLADAEFESMHGHRFPRAAALLEAYPDRVEREQYLDFLSCRTFRRTLLCRAEVTLSPAPLPAQVKQMWAISEAATDARPSELFSDASIRFRNRACVVVGLSDVLAKVALSCLISASPQALHFSELTAAVSAKLSAAGVAAPEPAVLDEALSELLIMLYSGDMVALYLQIPATAALPGEKPLASAIARAQARESAMVVNLWHRNLLLDDVLAQRLVPLLDGTRNLADLVAALTPAPSSVSVTEAPAATPDAIPEAIPEATPEATPEAIPEATTIGSTLQKLARLGLLHK